MKKKFLLATAAAVAAVFIGAYVLEEPYDPVTCYVPGERKWAVLPDGTALELDLSRGMTCWAGGECVAHRPCKTWHGPRTWVREAVLWLVQSGLRSPGSRAPSGGKGALDRIASPLLVKAAAHRNAHAGPPPWELPELP